MLDLSRRDFIKGAFTGLGALLAGRFLSACSSAAPASEILLPPPIKPATQSPQSGQRGISYPDLLVVKGGEPEDMARRAVEALGGIKRFVKTGDNVIVKPDSIPYINLGAEMGTGSADLSTLNIKEIKFGG